MKILFVCLGNICRSPTAEGVMRHMLRDTPLAVEVDSAGTAGYHVGAAPDPRTQRAANRRGIDLSGLRARRIEAGDFDRFDLILAMDSQNLADLERLRPKASRAQIGLFLQYAAAGALEVPDPYEGTQRDFERVLELCIEAAAGLIAVLKTRYASKVRNSQ